jgi:2-polyprenyl-6-methoxyphenol hydroxylase-like FAD-dependent oxidoreductase
MDALSVGVVGCGTAGAAAALFLARAGHRVTVYERVEDPKPVGAGITVQPTGQAVLARLGLLAPIVERGSRIDRLCMWNVRGKMIVELPYADVAGDLFGIGLHRGVLFETLLGAVRAQAGITLRLGADVASMRRDGDGRWLATTGGETLGPHQLLVLADGSVSELHPHCTIPHQVKPYPWGALWFVADDRERQFTADLRQWVDGPRHLFGILPTGLAPGDQRPVASVFWSVRADRVAAWRAAGIDAWKAQVRRFGPAAEPLLEQIREPEQLLFTQYRDVAMRHWHEPGAVFIGDAAHATSPQLGQGANLALWDAMVLADCVASAPTVDEALTAYTLARRRHLAYYQFATRALTPFFQSDSRLLGVVRDLIFPTSRWLRPLRRRMVRTMAGIDRGIIRRPIPLAEIRAMLNP